MDERFRAIEWGGNNSTTNDPTRTSVAATSPKSASEPIRSISKMDDTGKTSPKLFYSIGPIHRHVYIPITSTPDKDPKSANPAYNQATVGAQVTAGEVGHHGDVQKDCDQQEDQQQDGDATQGSSDIRTEG